MESLWYLQAYVILNTNFEYSMKWQNARRGAGRFLGDMREIRSQGVESRPLSRRSRS